VIDLGAAISSRAAVVTPDEAATEALDRAGQSGADHLIVVDEGVVKGLVGREELDRALAIHALPEAPSRHPI
jgi:hypothetical protein